MMHYYSIYNQSYLGYNVSYIFNLTSNNGSGGGGDGVPLCDQAGDNTSICVGPDGTPLIFLTAFDYLLAIVLAIFILCIVIGNCFVILSVLLFREMRTQTNGMIVSLASADLLVAIIVLPISLHFEIMDNIWTLGPYVCDFWITADVFCCTASILNIVGIAVDRYWLITKNVRYTHSSTFSRQRVCIILATSAWISSAIISSLPLLGWKSESDREDPTQCMITQDLGYTIFSTFGAFWFPLSVILIVYAKIFSIARKRAKSRAKQRSVHPSINTSTVFNDAQNGHRKQRYQRPSESGSPQGSPSNQGSIRQSEHNNNTNGSVRFHEEAADNESVHSGIQGGSIHSNTTVGTQGSLRHQNGGTSSIRRQIGRGLARTYVRRGRGRRLAASRDSRARARNRTRNSARTLGLIIGGFVLCWLPFFTLTTILPFCAICAVSIPPPVHSVALWLGYSNSLLNPAIYAIWDKNFRRSFKRLVHCDVRWSMVL